MKEMGANSSSQESDPLIDNTNNFWQPGPSEYYVQRFHGWIRTFRSLKAKERLYLALGILGISLMIEFLYYLLGSPKQDQETKTFIFLLFWSLLFCGYYLYHGLFTDNPYELLVYTMTIIMIYAYIIIDFIIKKNTSTKVRLIVASIICPLLILMGMIFAWKHTVSISRLLFHYVTVGENQRIHAQHNRTISLLIFDVQLSVTAFIIGLHDMIFNSFKPEAIAFITGILITLVFFILGLISLRYELKWMVYICLLLSPIKIIIIVHNLVAYDGSKYPNSLKYGVFICGIIAIVIRITLIFHLFVCKKHFGRLIMQRVYGTNLDISQQTSNNTHQVSNSKIQESSAEFIP